MLNINVYPTTSMVKGDQSKEERIEELIIEMQDYIESFYCDNRGEYKAIKVIFNEAFKRFIKAHKI